MANIGRRSAGTEDQSGPSVTEMDGGTSSGVEFVGVSDEEIERDAGALEGVIFRGAHFRSITVEDTAAEGSEITIYGELSYNNPARFISKVDVRIVVESPAYDNPVIEEAGALKDGQSTGFSINVPVVGSKGSTLPLTVKAQAKGTPGWNTGESAGPFPVEIVSDQQKTIQSAVSKLPTIGAGAVAGAGVAQFTGRSPLVLGGLGAAGGAIYSTSDFRFTLPDLPTTEIAIIGAGLAGAAFFLRSTGASDVLQPAGEAAGGVIGAGSEVAGRARDRLASPR